MHKLIVVSSYPPRGSVHHPSIVGVATYTKNTLISLVNKVASKQSLQITVLAEELPNAEKIYHEDGIVIKRIWQRKSIMTFWRLFKFIHTTPPSTQILFELELAMFGGIIHLLPLPFFLLYLKLSRRKTTVIAHQIITSLSEVHGQLNLPKKGIRIMVLTFFLRLFYRIVLKASSEVVVFDEFLKEKLATLDHSVNVTVIPHGVEEFRKLPTQTEARDKLGLPQDQPLLLYFGFLAWYKGVDILLDAYSKLEINKRPLLLLAGGPNPNHTDKKFYKEYLDKIQQKATENNVIITGFVPEQRITDYFIASNLCVLPYRVFMSSSGPLSFAFSTSTPFLLSDTLMPLFQTQDIAKIIKKIGINTDELTFTSQDDLQVKITNLLTDFKLQQTIKELDRQITISRSWDYIAEKYRTLLGI